MAAAAKPKTSSASRRVQELESGIKQGGRVRAPGADADHPSAAAAAPGLVPTLEELVDPVTRNGPLPALR